MSKREVSYKPVNGLLIKFLGMFSFSFPMLGPFAWFMGNSAIKAINAGEADPNQRSNVVVGRTCGIVGSYLILVWSIILVPLFVHPNTPVVRLRDTVDWAILLDNAKDVTARLDKDPALVNEKGISGKPLLFEAVSRGNKDIVQIFIDHGANVNSTDAAGGTPLDQAKLSKQADIAQLLISHGAKPGTGK